jgi:hypothetical protein
MKPTSYDVSQCLSQAGDKSQRQPILSIKMFGLRDPFGKTVNHPAIPENPLGRAWRIAPDPDPRRAAAGA